MRITKRQESRHTVPPDSKSCTIARSEMQARSIPDVAHARARGGGIGISSKTRISVIRVPARKEIGYSKGVSEGCIRNGWGSIVDGDGENSTCHAYIIRG